MKSGIKRSLGIVLCSMLMVLAMAFPVSASTKVDAPKYFRVESVGNLSVNLRWSKNFSVSGYELYQYDSASRRSGLFQRTATPVPLKISSQGRHTNIC